MVRNVGSIDKIVRLVLGIGLGAWGILSLGTTMSYLAIGVGVILIATALMNFCPLFRILGISSHKSGPQ